MRVLITGGSGMLGATLGPLLRTAGYDVVIHGNASGDVRCDLTDRLATTTLLREVGAHYIVNLVALTNVDQCEADPHAAYLLNVRTVENIVAALHGQQDVRLVHISTDQMYDAAGPNNEDEVRLTNTYALTKYAGEMAAAMVGATVLRTNFFGPSALPGRKSFSDWLLRSFQEKMAFSTFSDVIVNPLSMTTLGTMIDNVMRQPKTAGVFNLGSRTSLSKADFALRVADLFRFDVGHMVRCHVDERGLRAYRPKDMSMDCSHFEQTFKVKLPTLQSEIETLKKDIP